MCLIFLKEKNIHFDEMRYIGREQPDDIGTAFGYVQSHEIVTYIDLFKKAGFVVSSTLNDNHNIHVIPST